MNLWPLLTTSISTWHYSQIYLKITFKNLSDIGEKHVAIIYRFSYPCDGWSCGFFSKSWEKYEAKLLPMKSEDVEADKDADCDIAIAAGVAGADAGAVAVAVPPLSNLIMVSRIH